MSNYATNYVKLLKEIWEEEGIAYTALSDGWVFQLEKNDKTAYIFGYQFGLNKASAAQLCNDKCTTSEVLALAGIPHIPHYCFLTCLDMRYADPKGNWEKLISLFEQHKTLVCKDNNGTGGDSVYLAHNRLEFENIIQRLMATTPAVAVSPYVSIREEYRLIVLDGTIRLVYSKERQFVLGDGKQTLRHLIAAAYSNGAIHAFPKISDSKLSKVLEPGEKFYLNWKHNLGQGATPMIVKDADMIEKLSALALSAVSKVGIRFASVDIVDTEEGLKVMEINCGVMMEYLSGENASYRKIAKGIYKDALGKMFES
ncbi:MAG: hypothetical protein K6G65_10535 [Lachnospiraceae bacterium]|nr:hypothetical protein [Lachnospiraceae bacterium]